MLNDRNAYTHFLKFYYPELPPRRAFFLAQGDRRVVYTYLSDRLEEDLRHEATHALVRGCYGDLPLWLDEGLAEYFETRADMLDIQDEHMARLPEDLKKGWIPDLPRLESLSDIHEMTPRLSRSLGLGPPDARRYRSGQSAADRLSEPGQEGSADEAPPPDTGNAWHDGKNTGRSP